MKKEIILFMLTLLGTLSATSADGDFKSISLTCSEDSPLVKQMTSEMIEQVESLTISGTLWEEDIRTIDKCSRLSRLDLTEVTLKDSVYFFDESATVDGYVDAIGADAFCHTAIETLFLPKSIGYLDLRAVSFFAWDKDSGRPAADYGKNDDTDEPHFEKTITVYVTGNFPELFNPQSVGGYYGCPMEFRLAKGNDQYTETDGNIFTKDGLSLVKAGNLYDESLPDCTFDVQFVSSHAFTYTLWSDEEQLITFTEKLNRIHSFAFSEVAHPSRPAGTTSGRWGGIRFLGWTPAQIDEESVLTNSIDMHPFPCTVVVPHKMRYVASDIRWLPNVMDDFEYGIKCGTKSTDERDAFYSEQDKYGPRIEDLYKKINETYQNMEVNALILYSSALFHGWKFKTEVNVSFPTDYSYSFSFVNPETNKKETIECVLGRLEVYSIETQIKDKEGKIFCKGESSIQPGMKYNYDYSVLDERPDDSNDCLVSCRITGKNYLGPLDEYVMECVFEEDAAQNINNLVIRSNNNSLYDLTGRPADGTQKGILIRNGKKVIVK